MFKKIIFALSIASQAIAQQQTPEVNVPPAPAVYGAEIPNDRYQFADNFSTQQQITLTRTPGGVRFAWPHTGNWDTAILGVNSWGAENEPWVEITAGTSHIQQYFDANAQGLRWLNLSLLKDQLKESTQVDIITHAITIEPAAATLRLFENKLNLNDKILILAPHPDDAEIAAFGLYADHNATIVTVTSGNAGDMNYRASVSDPAEHYLLKGYLRAVDSVTIPWQGQIPPDRTYNLGYFDARLAEMHQSPDQAFPEMYGPNDDVAPYRRANISKMLPTTSRKNNWTNLVEDLTQILNKVKPKIIVMPHPWLDSHLDHEYTAVALVEALGQWKDNATFLLYTNHASENRYPYGPAGTVMSLPAWSVLDISLQSVYSHPMSEQLQIRKLYALESMHDLRLSPDEQKPCNVPRLIVRPDYPRSPEVDYFRRGPRANELFYVYNRDGVMEVIKSFLAMPSSTKQEIPKTDYNQ